MPSHSDADELRDAIAAAMARLDQMRAEVTESRESEPEPDSLDGFLSRLEEDLLELRDLRANLR